jgi:hypothetical protein
MTELRFARRPEWAPLVITDRIARRRVKVCAAIHLDLDAPSTVRGWEDNGGTPSTQSSDDAFAGWIARSDTHHWDHEKAMGFAWRNPSCRAASRHEHVAVAAGSTTDHCQVRAATLSLRYGQSPIQAYCQIDGNANLVKERGPRVEAGLIRRIGRPDAIATLKDKLPSFTSLDFKMMGLQLIAVVSPWDPSVAHVDYRKRRQIPVVSAMLAVLERASGCRFVRNVLKSCDCHLLLLL